MTRSEGPFRTRNPWARIAWWSIAALIVVGWMLGFVVLGREQQNGPPLSPWAAICRGLGLTADLAPATNRSRLYALPRGSRGRVRHSCKSRPAMRSAASS